MGHQSLLPPNSQRLLAHLQIASILTEIKQIRKHSYIFIINTIFMEVYALCILNPNLGTYSILSCYSWTYFHLTPFLHFGES